MDRPTQSVKFSDSAYSIEGVAIKHAGYREKGFADFFVLEAVVGRKLRFFEGCQVAMRSCTTRPNCSTQDKCKNFADFDIPFLFDRMENVIYLTANIIHKPNIQERIGLILP